jgi:hypothetical protein
MRPPRVVRSSDSTTGKPSRVERKAISKAVSDSAPGLSRATRGRSRSSGAMLRSVVRIVSKKPRNRANGVRRCSPAITREVIRRLAIA